jgi:hypothetical protein
MLFQSIAGYLLSGILTFGALFSWFLMITGRFRPHIIMPCETEECKQKASFWFFMQSLLLLFAGGIALMRTTQIQQGHTDNVIENLIYGLSSLLLIRVIGEFKVLGFFRSENESEFAQTDRKIITPYFLIAFLLSLALVI